MLFHVLGHVEPDQRLHRLEHLVCQALDKFRFAHARRADEDERHRALFRRHAHAVSADSGGDGADCLVLSDDMRFEPRIEVFQLLILLRADFACRNLGPELNDAREVFHRQNRLRLFFQQRNFLIELQVAAAKLCHTGKVVLRLFCLLQKHSQFDVVVCVLFFERFELADGLVFEVHVGACLVDQINCLIGQEPVGDIPLGENDRLACNLRRNGHAVEFFIVMRNAAQDFNCLFDRRLVDRYGLEAPFERGVLFDVLAVFIEGCRADDLNFAAREGRLQDICRVHRALCIARADKIVDLVDDQNDIAELFDLVDEAFHAAFKLTSKLRACNERGQIHQIDFLALELVGHLLIDNPLR